MLSEEGGETVVTKEMKRIASLEPLGAIPIKFVDGTYTLKAGASTNEFDCDFLEPQRYNRLFQVRPSILIITQETGRREIGVANVVAGLQYFAADLKLYVSMMGSKRFGTDISETVEVAVSGGNTITQTLGGVGGGIVNAVMIPFMDDESELYDIWTYFGAYPTFKIENGTNVELGAENFEWGGLKYNLEYYLVLTGMKYLLADVTDEERKLLEGRELPEIGVPIAGVDVKTTRE